MRDVFYVNWTENVLKCKSFLLPSRGFNVVWVLRTTYRSTAGPQTVRYTGAMLSADVRCTNDLTIQRCSIFGSQLRRVVPVKYIVLAPPYWALFCSSSTLFSRFSELYYILRRKFKFAGKPQIIPYLYVIRTPAHVCKFTSSSVSSIAISRV